MKRNVILLPSVVILFSIGSAFADLSQGLIAYYPFSGNANDARGQGHDGTVYGATLTMDRFGNSESAYSFDGVDDCIEVPNTNDAFNLYVWTISAWCKPLTSLSSFTSGPVMWKTSYNDFNYDTFGLTWMPGDEWLLKLERASNDEDIHIYSSSYAPGSWHIVTGAYDGQNISIYVDGELDDTRYVGEIIAYTGPAPLMIGSNLNTNHTGRGVFNGPIDEVRIYNRALSSGEVAMLAGIPAVATIEISPDPLYLDSKGKWITCTIEPPEGYSVSEIDVDSILLEGLFEAQHSLEVRNSAVQDSVLMVKFDRQDLIAYIELILGITSPDYVTLMVIGDLTDGFMFKGTDVIRVTGEK